jgi:ubiquinone/menaquinone biosynthesis C-methylase UbiE
MVKCKRGGRKLNNVELRKKVHSAMYTLIKEKGVASPAEVLIAIGVLPKEKYDDWRFGRIPYLEKVCQINLSKLSTIHQEIRAFAQKNNLKPSWTDYRKWGKGNRIRLRFSKSGNERVEELYATHYVSPQKSQAEPHKGAEE